MGSSNVACSISSLSISYGTSVVYIPLLKRYHKNRKYFKAISPEGFGWFEYPSSSLCYPNDIFEAFSLPIKGTYNDYWGLENIERSENVEVLEKFFGITIEKIIACGHCSKGIENFTGEIARNFYMHQEWRDPFDENYLINIGFEYLEGDTFKHPYIENIFLKLIPEIRDREGRSLNNPSYILFDKDYKVLEERLNLLGPSDYLMKDFLKRYSYYLNIRKEDQEKVSILFNMSGMFIHGDIYKSLSQKSVYKNWGGEIINIEDAYEIYTQKVKKYLELENKVESAENEEVLKNSLRELWRLENPFSSSNPGNFVSFFKDWEYFEKLYSDLFCSGKLKKEFVEYVSFYKEMRDMNRFLFPSCNGTQNGNPFASKRLLEKSLEIVNSEIEETRKEYSGDGEIYDESSIY